MKRLFLTILAAPLLVTAATLPASAQTLTAQRSLNGPDLVVSFTETGLPANQDVLISMSYQAAATYVCVNRGGGSPRAGKKITVQMGGGSTANGFTADATGTATGSITFSPPGAHQATCPPGQTLELASVTYSNITVTDTTNNITTTVPDISGCLLPNVRDAC